MGSFCLYERKGGGYIIGHDECFDPEGLVRPSALIDILKRYHIRPSHSLGQNFLVDQNILLKITDTADLSHDDLVLEVGPGLGTLTAALSARAMKVCAIEMDRTLADALSFTLSNRQNVDIIFADVLRMDLHSVFGTSGSESSRRWKIVSNLPYYITSPFLLKILQHLERVSRMVLMVQWEVAKRITASPGTKDYGVVSVMVQYFFAPSIIQKVSPRSFFPPPDVYSGIVLLEPRENLLHVDSIEVFKKVVNMAFGQRRKTISNALAPLLGKEQIMAMLRGKGIHPSIRGESLGIEQFACIANEVYRLCNA